MRERNVTLAYITIEKLFENFLKNSTPLKVSGKQSQKEVLNEIKGALTSLDFFRVKNRKDYWVSGSNKPALEIEYGTSSYWRENKFTLYFDKDELTLKTGSFREPVSDTEHLIRFLEAVKKKYRERENRALKRKKLLNLKSKAIESRVRTLAEEMKFDYFLDKYYQNKVKLTIRLDDLDGIEIDIPYNRFQEVLDGVGKTVQNIAELYEKGLKFKVKPVRSHKWVKCSDRKDS
jgi:hypothetical protein